MNKLLFFLLFLPFYGMAQPVLGNNVFTQIGDIIKLQPAQPNNVSEGPAGANQSWNFSGLIPKPSSAFQLKYLDAAVTPYADSFAFSNMATEYVSEDNVISYGYFNQTGNEIWFLGAAFEEATQILTQPDLLARTPMKYGDFNTHSYSGVFHYPGFTGDIYGVKTSKYDAYGTLKMPGITYSNAIRTRTQETRTDSVSLGSGVYTLETTKEDYYCWFVPGIHSAVMEIRYSTLTTKTVIPGIPPQISTQPTEKTVTYQLGPVSATHDKPGQTAAFEMRMMSANPVFDQTVSLSFSTRERLPITLALLSGQGQILEQKQIVLEAGSQIHNLDLMAFPSGVYYLSASGPSGTVSQKLVKY
jgi:hypothetical protein